MNTPTTKTIEELKAELAAAEQKLYEEKQAVLRAEREAKLEAERKEREAKEKAEMVEWEAHAKEIVKELKAVGFKDAAYTLPNSGRFPRIKCLPNDQYVDWEIAFEVSYNRDTWRPRENGVVVNVGQYGEKSRYPELKAGGFNYKKIAATAWEKYQNKLAADKRKQQARNAEEGNKARVTRLQNEFGSKPYADANYCNIKNVGIFYYDTYGQGRDYRSVARKDNDLSMHITHISEEDAQKILQFMRENDIVIVEEK